MSPTGGIDDGRIADAADLGAAVSRLSRELELLSSRVAELAVAADAIAAERVDRRDDQTPPAPSRPQHSPRRSMESVTVTVRPLPELAMAAMAETSLRGLPGVDQVVSVERFEDWARFTLDVLEGTDLITEMRAALPLPFRSEQSASGEITLDLKWVRDTVQ